MMLGCGVSGGERRHRDAALALVKLGCSGGLMATGEYVTHQELAVVVEGLATKEDLERFATKEDLERFATKEDLRRVDGELERIDDHLKRIEDKMEARFAGLYALIRDYLLNDAQRDDWDHRNGS